MTEGPQPASSTNAAGPRETGCRNTNAPPCRTQAVGREAKGFTGRSWSLKNGAFLFDDFLDLFLTEPYLGVAFQIHHLQIDLVEHRLRPVGLVENRRNGALHHIIGADLFPRSFLRVLSRVHRLLFALGAKFLAISFSCDKGDFLRVRQLALKIGHKRLTLICSWLLFEMVPTTTTGWRRFELVKLFSQGYSSASLTMDSATILESVSFQRPLRVGDDARVDTSYLGFRAAPNRSGEYQRSDRHAAAFSSYRSSRDTSSHMREVREPLGLSALRPFVFFFFKPFKELVGILADVIANLRVEFLGLLEIILHLLEIQLGQDVIGAGFFVFIPFDRPARR